MIPDIVTKLAQAFQAQGKELYLVGGLVRDQLLGKVSGLHNGPRLEGISHDIDCATNALPEEIQKIAATTDPLHILPIGEKFGTIQLHYSSFFGPYVVEVTTYRGEHYLRGSRKPEVKFGSNLIDDLQRRDFTINAIALHPLTGEIVDPFCGQRDLVIGCIRAVEDPMQRFTDDPLRMLRAVRLAAQLDFIVARHTEQAIRQQAHQLATISQERIRDEFRKILLTPMVIVALENLLEWGLFAVFLPEMVALAGVGQKPHHSCDVFDHTTLVVKQTPAILAVRLAALLHDIAKPLTRTEDELGNTHFYRHEDVGAEMARTILRRLRFSNNVVEHVAKVVQLHMRVNAYTPKWSNGAVRHLYIDAGDVLDDLLDLAVADGISDRDEPAATVRSRIDHLKARLEQVNDEAGLSPLVSPLDGHELMTLFDRKPGPWVKIVKSYLANLVIRGTIPSKDKAAATFAAQRYMEILDQPVKDE